MSVDDIQGFPDEGPLWTPVEQAELLQAFDSAFLDGPIPEGSALVADPTHSDAGPVLEACAGRHWRSLDSLSLFKAQDFSAQCTDEAFALLLSAYIRAIIVGGDDLRLDLEQIAVSALSPEFRGPERLRRRLDMFNPEQLRLLYRVLQLRHRLHTEPSWPETEFGRFWTEYLRGRGVVPTPA